MLQMIVRGTPYERGHQIGEAFGERLRDEINERRDCALRGWTLETAEAAMGNVLFAMLRLAPRYVVDGAGLDFRDAFVLNVAPDFPPCAPPLPQAMARPSAPRSDTPAPFRTPSPTSPRSPRAARA